MALVSKEIPNLINGVSQQPPEVRLASQGEIQENGLSTVVRGLEKRPGTEIVKKLDFTSTGNYLIHPIRRDETEEYTLILGKAGSDKFIKIFDGDGNEMPIQGSNNAATPTFATLANSHLGYFSEVTDFSTEVTATTVTDTTFFCSNQKIITKATLTGETSRQDNSLAKSVKGSDSLTGSFIREALVYVKQGGFNSKYEVTIKVGSQHYKVGYQTPATQPVTNQQYIGTETIARILKEGASAVSGDGWGEFDATVATNLTEEGFGGRAPLENYDSSGVASPDHWDGFDDTGAGSTILAMPSGMTCTRTGSTLHFKHTADFEISTTDSHGDTDIFAIMGAEGGAETKSFTDLPASNISNGFITKIVGDNLQGQDDFYVKFEADSLGKGVWKECVGPDEYHHFNYNTMPHRIVRLFDDSNITTANPTGTTFVFEAVTATSDSLREVGGVAFTGSSDGGLLITSTAHGLIETEIIRVANSGGALPGNLVADTDYYVKYVSANTFRLATSSGGGAIAHSSDGTPINTWYNVTDYSRIGWNARLAGDDTLSPFPSFVGGAITDIFFHKNRLGFLNDENVIFSEAGNYYNYFPLTVISGVDSNPIDVTVSNDKVSLLRHAVPFAETLLFFSELQQFKLAEQAILSPATVSIDVTTQFETDARAKPVSVGRYVFFAFQRGNFSGVREYFVDNKKEINDAVEVTAHVPQYIPGKITNLVSSSNEQILVCQSSDELQNLYVYKYYWQENDKIQSSWSVWKFGNNILNCAFIGSTLQILISRSDGVYLENLNLSTDSSIAVMEDDTSVLLDRRVKMKSSTSVDTLSDLPYYTSIPSDIVYVNQNAQKIAQADVDTRIVAGDTIYAGIPYNFKYEFTRFLYKSKEEVAIQAAKLQLRNINVLYSNTGFFKLNIEVAPYTISIPNPDIPGTTKDITPRKAYEKTFSGFVTNSSQIGEYKLLSGSFKSSILSSPQNCRISLTNDEYLPCAFQSAEWEGFLNIRSQRI